jgi:hypothetical protein
MVGAAKPTTWVRVPPALLETQTFPEASIAAPPPASVRFSLKDFQEAVSLADGEAGQEKVLLDFSD